MSCLFPLKENPQTPHSSSFSLMMSEMIEKAFMSPGAFTAAGEVPREINELPPTISTWWCLHSTFGTRTFSTDFGLRPSFRYSFPLMSLTLSLSESTSL